MHRRGATSWPPGAGGAGTSLALPGQPGLRGEPRWRTRQRLVASLRRRVADSATVTATPAPRAFDARAACPLSVHRYGLP
ncbi:hypothetical protein PA39016_002160001 [Pseudomonas aeruginosa 39016]|nr:hypothetical protein PA39016_002160001 [Pseudomonas aeruginosa 39016]